LNKLKLGLAAVATGTLAGAGLLAAGLGTTTKPPATHQSAQQTFHGDTASFQPNTGIPIKTYATMEDCQADLPAQQAALPHRDLQCSVSTDPRDAEAGTPIVLEADPHDDRVPTGPADTDNLDSPQQDNTAQPEDSTQPSN
jgi:hypothetical protein